MMDGCKTLLIGLGNPILGDDGVGWRVVETFRDQNACLFVDQPIDIDFLSVGGLSLMEHMVGYDYALLVDAALTGKHPFGFVSYSTLEELPQLTQGHLSSSHDTTLQNALAIGRNMGAYLPNEIWVINVEAENIYEFSEQLSPLVEKAVPQAADIITHLLDKICHINFNRQPQEVNL
jgi:hydrogenase maturation protease